MTLGENAGLPLAVLTWCAVLSGMEAGGAGGSGPKRVGKQYYPDIGFFDMIEKAPGVSVKKGTCKFCRADVDLSKTDRRHRHLAQCRSFEPKFSKSFAEWAQSANVKLHEDVQAIIYQREAAKQPAKRQRLGEEVGGGAGGGSAGLAAAAGGAGCATPALVRGGSSGSLLATGFVKMGNLTPAVKDEFQMRWAR